MDVARHILDIQYRISLAQDHAPTVVNHVIDAYRGATNEPWARRLTESEIFEIKGEITHANGMIEGVATVIAPGYEITLPIEASSISPTSPNNKMFCDLRFLTYLIQHNRYRQVIP